LILIVILLTIHARADGPNSHGVCPGKDRPALQVWIWATISFGSPATIAQVERQGPLIKRLGLRALTFVMVEHRQTVKTMGHSQTERVLRDHRKANSDYY